MLYNEYNVSCRFVEYGLYYVEVCSLYNHFLESFYHKWVLNFVRTFFCTYWSLGFPGGSDGKKSACNAGDPSLIPGSGRSPREGNGNPLQYSGLGNPMDRGTWWWATVHGVTKEYDTTWQLNNNNSGKIKSGHCMLISNLFLAQCPRVSFIKQLTVF